MSKDFGFSILFPLLALALIALVGGGLGFAFIVLRETMGNVWGVIILGSALVVLVPTGAYLLTRNEPFEE